MPASEQIAECPVEDLATLVLTGEYIARRVPSGAYVVAVRRAFEQLARAQLDVPAVAHVRGFNGAFHIKSATGLVSPQRVAIKLNANFPSNPAQYGLPTIQGVIALFDAQCGRLLALMDSVEVTAQRTAAASVVAAQCLARADSSRLALIGCGTQARYHLAALLEAFPIRHVTCYDISAQAAKRQMDLALARDLDADVAASVHAAAARADIVVTTTSSHAPLLGADDVRPGCFVAAVGADNPDKHEIAPELLRRARVVPDVLSQARVMGDLHHALDAGTMDAADIHGELADIVSGRVAGRTHSEQIFVFDSTGTAIADLAAANIIFDIARKDAAAPRFQMAV